MLLKLSLAALFLPFALLLFNMSNVYLRARRSENNLVVEQNREVQNVMSGAWVIYAPQGADKARLQLQRGGDSVSVHVPFSQLPGLDPGAETSRANFQLVRDSGTFTLTGSFSQGKGSGVWNFKGSSTFVSDLQKYGYDKLTDENLLWFAFNNLTAAYIGELAQTGYRNLPVHVLVSLYSNDVRAGYITSLAAAGYSKLSPGDLIALKSNGVTSAYIKSLQSRGYKNLSVQQILSIRTNTAN